MTRNEASAAIINRLIDSALVPANRIQIDNAGTDSTPFTDGGPWARVTVSHNTARVNTLGGGNKARRRDRFGVFTVQVFTPIRTGTETSETLAENIADLYEGQGGDRPLYYDDINTPRIGPDGSWFQTNVVVNFRYQVTK